MLRLPNVLAFMPFLIFIHKLSNLISSKLLGTLAFILIILNPFLLDFFSLARGYGIALSFQSISMYFWITSLKTHTRRDSLIFAVTGFLSVLSNFTFIIFLAPAVLVLLMRIIHNHRQFNLNYMCNVVKSNISWLLIAASGIVYLMLIFFKLRTSSALYFGGSTNFINDTIHSLVTTVFYDIVIDPVIIDIVTWVIAFFICFSICLVTYKLYKVRVLFPLTYITLLIFFMICLNITQNIVLKTPYLFERTALLYVPILSLLGFYLLDYLTSLTKVRSLLIVVVALPLITACVLNASLNFNVTHYFSWRYEADNKLMLEHVKKLSNKEEKTLAVYWLFYPSVSYYLDIQQIAPNIHFQTINDLEHQLPEADYYFLIGDAEQPNLIKEEKFLITGNTLYTTTIN
jgi:hypothetical protein